MKILIGIMDILKMTKNWLIILFTLMLGCLSFAGSAMTDRTPLSVEEAFKFSATMKTHHELMASWQIAPGYYLYKQRFQFQFKPAIPTKISYPQGSWKHQVNHGRYEVFSDNLMIPIVFKSQDNQIEMTVNYQGCSEDGFCYPPIQKVLSVDLNKQIITEASASTFAPVPKVLLKTLLTNQNQVQWLLHSSHFAFTLLLFVGIGLLLAFTPCVLPMVPILASIIVGQEKISNRKNFFLSLSYVLGMAIMYAVAGIMIASLGSSLQVWLQKPYVIIATSGLFVLLGLSLFGWFELRLPSRLHNHFTHLSNRQTAGTYVGVFIMGALSTLIISPCVTAPLVGILMYIAETGDHFLGASALFALGIGMGIPLLLVGVSAGKWLPKSGPWMEAIKKIVGLLMMGMAIWLLSRIFSPSTITLLCGLLIISAITVIGIYCALLPKVRLQRNLGLMVGLAGLLLFLGGVNVTDLVVKEWTKTNLQMQEFTIVRNIADVNKQLLIANSLQRPIVLDFYADWCESCVVMDRKVFSKPDVQQELSKFILLRADLTDNTTENERLLKYFNVIAPPTILFFDVSGQEMSSKRIIGEVNSQEFVDRLQKIS